MLSTVLQYPRPESLRRLEHEYSFGERLDPRWSARPIAIARHWDRTVLVLEDPGGVPLDQLLGRPANVEFFLRLAIGLSTAIDQLHERGVIHKEIKPGNILQTLSAASAGSRALASHRGRRASACLLNLRNLSPGPLPTWHPNRPDE